jgi:cyclase
MRRSAFFLVLLACVVLAAAPAAHAQRNFADVVITPLKLADGLWMLTGSGGNLLACAGPDGALLVDAQYGQLAARIHAVTDSLGGGRPLRFVLNTHYHGDPSAVTRPWPRRVPPSWRT